MCWDPCIASCRSCPQGAENSLQLLVVGEGLIASLVEIG